MAYPLSVHWMPLAGGTLKAPVQIVIGAPKRKLHHAVERNRAKRLIRECYRLRKSRLLDIAQQHNSDIALSINYISNEIISFGQMSLLFDKLIERLSEQIQQELCLKKEQ